jgi:hypothetical protein
MKNTLKQFAFRAARLALTARCYFPLAIAIALLALAGSASAQTDLNLNGGSFYVNMAKGVAWGSTFNRTYVLSPNSPNTSVCVYVINNNPTSAHSFTLNIFQAGDPSLPDYSNNTARYSSVTVLGNFSPLSASSQGSAFAQTTGAAKIAFQFAGSSTQAGNPDTADLFLVQTSNGTCGSASAAIPVQGPANVGTTLGLGNPVLIGAKDFNGAVRSATIIVAGTNGTNADGLAIGDGGISTTSTFNTMTLPTGTVGGPMAVGLFATAANGGTLVNLKRARSVPGQTSNGEMPGGLYTGKSGYLFTYLPLPVSISQNLNLWNDNAGSPDVSQDGGPFSSCRLDISAANTGGTTPTLDVYLQDSLDHGSWTDRIHLQQFTTGTVTAWAETNPSASVTSKLYTDGTLAVSTNVDGLMGNYGRLKFVLGGTASPSYSVSLSVVCF